MGFGRCGALVKRFLGCCAARISNDSPLTSCAHLVAILSSKFVFGEVKEAFHGLKKHVLHAYLGSALLLSRAETIYYKRIKLEALYVLSSLHSAEIP